MKLQLRSTTQSATLDDSNAGEGLAIFFSQGLTDEGRWRLEVFAELDDGRDLLVGTVFISPPTATNPIGPPTRQVAAAVCPGAKSWSVLAVNALNTQSGASESADINLYSSKCCTAPVGLSRVNERYGYKANTTPGGSQLASLLPGQTITRITAFGLVGGGTVVLGPGNTITVAAGVSINLEPKALIRLTTGFPDITFTNVNWLIEFLESA